MESETKGRTNKRSKDITLYKLLNTSTLVFNSTTSFSSCELTDQLCDQNIQND